MNSNDTDFVSRLRERDAHSWSQLFRSLYRCLRLAALRMCGPATPEERIEDMVQETLVAAFCGIDRFREESAVATWIISILRNKCASHCQRQTRAPLLPLTDKDAGSLIRNDDDSADTARRLALLDACLDELITSKKTGRATRTTLEFIRELLEQGKTIPSIRKMAETWHCSERAAKWRWFETRRVLKKRCEQKLRQLR